MAELAIGIGIGVSFQATSGTGILPQAGDILMEDGVSHIELENGSGVIALEG